jgi:feruloyl esterase
MDQGLTVHQRWFRLLGGAAIVLGLTVLPQATRAGTSPACDKLASMALPKAKIDSAQMVLAGTFAPPAGGGAANAYANLPAFCRVTATLTPTSDSDIKTEIWLPAKDWNGKFQAVGNGGWAGTIPYAALARTVASGYAGAGTDTGHTSNNADFALGHPEKLIDLAYRSIHEMTVQAKTIIKAHYGSAPKVSYYNGCSQGGRQGLAAAQKYPADFNGIIAGAASWNQMRAHAARVGLNLIVNKDANSRIPRNKYAMIHDAVVNACDELDGVKDGVIENPLMCKFDYAQLACKEGDGPNCLTNGQVESAKAMTSPLTDPKTGTVLFEGHLMPGSELGWATLGGPEPLGLAVSGMRNVVTKDQSWDYHSLDIATDIERAGKSDKGALYSGDANLKPFFERGGKLLMYHGWSDQQVNPLNSVIYYDNVLKTVGSEKAANSIALFMVPGMNHCSGGPGTDTFDKVKIIEEWVEQGKKPTEVVASHLTSGQVDKTRPLCPYPQVAKYKGTGSINEAGSFYCAAESTSGN